jgi:hypothetical protein
MLSLWSAVIAVRPARLVAATHELTSVTDSLSSAGRIARTDDVAHRVVSIRQSLGALVRGQRVMDRTRTARGHSTSAILAALATILLVGSYSGALQENVEDIKAGTVVTEHLSVGSAAAEKCNSVLSTDVKGRTSLMFYTMKRVLWLGVADDVGGAPEISFLNSRLERRLLINSPKDGSARFMATPENSRAKLEFTVSSNRQSPSMVITDDAGETRIAVDGSSSREDSAVWSLADPKGTKRLSLWRSGHKAFLFITDTGSKLRAAVGLAPDSPPGMSLFDSIARGARLELTGDLDGRPAIKLNDLKQNRSKILQ